MEVAFSDEFLTPKLRGSSESSGKEKLWSIGKEFWPKAKKASHFFIIAKKLAIFAERRKKRQWKGVPKAGRGLTG